MRSVYFFSMTILLILSTNKSVGQEQFDCGFGGFDELLSMNDPNYVQRKMASEALYISQNLCENPGDFYGPYEIPVVVHIMHNGGTENISNEQIYSAIEQANDQLAGLEGGFNTQIKLVLAKKDPAGYCTDGILRLNTPNPFIASYPDLDSDLQIKNLSRWPPDRYLNIWIVRSINGGILGYAFNPHADDVYDGIVIKHSAFGTIGTAQSADYNTLVHEFGHYLYLSHVWGPDYYYGPAECEIFCHNIDNGASRGDYVCDTPPCIKNEDGGGLDCNQFFESCIDCPIWYQDLAYPKENYMSYNDDCQYKFTEGQAKRMWFTINNLREKTFSVENRICTGILGYYGENIVINSNTSWTTSNLPNNGEITINGNLTIESNSTLTIGAGVIVHFCSDKKLVIKQNGKLTLSGTLTNSCGKSWKGIEVWGNTSLPQTLVGGVMPQGVFVGLSGSVIENAQTGIQLWGPDKETGAGGQASCNETIFKNNHVGVEFAPYESTSQSGQPNSYKGAFKKCNFITDNAYSILEPFYAFIFMNGVRGVSVLASGFKNSQTIQNANSIVNFGYGIFSMDSGFKVEPICNGQLEPCTAGYTYSSFTGLGYGIYNSNMNASLPFLVKSVNFKDCYLGIYDSGVSMGTIVLNQFSLGNLPDPELADDQIGVMLENPIAGITLEENIFRELSGNMTNTIGVLCKSISSFNNQIRKNSFFYLSNGNVSNGLNANIYFEPPPRGLRYICNYNAGITGDDIQVTNGRIRREQGLEIPGSNPIKYTAVGNIFSPIVGSNENVDNDGASFRYHYYQVTPQTPQNPSGFTIETAAENSCETNFCLPPCLTPTEADQRKISFNNNKILLASTMIAYNNAVASNNAALIEQKSREAGHYKSEMDKYAHLVTLHILYDTISFNQDTLNAWLRNLDCYAAELWLANNYFKQGNFITLNNILNNIPSKFQLTASEATDLNTIHNIYDLLENESVYDLSGSSISYLESIANNSSGLYARKIAQNLLTLIGWHFPPEYDLNSGQYGFRSSTDQENIENSISAISIYPNPANEVVTFDFKELKLISPALLEVFNETGQIVMTTKITKEQHSINWNTTEINSGIYFYQLKLSDGTIYQGKMVILK